MIGSGSLRQHVVTEAARCAVTLAICAAAMVGCRREKEQIRKPTSAPATERPESLYEPQEPWPEFRTTELDDPPAICFDNGQMEIVVLLPHPRKGFYRDVRFDWSGMIGFAAYRGHTFIGRWETAPGGRKARKYSLGTSDDFRTRKGKSIRTGGGNLPLSKAWIRIGVGKCVLKETAKAGRPHRYLVVDRPFEWQVTHGPGWIQFRQQVKNLGGWGYDYTKRIELSRRGPAFTIRRTLRNTGSERLSRVHYCHNWFRIDEDLGAGYRAAFPFELKWIAEKTPMARLDGKRILFGDAFKQESDKFFGRLRGFDDESDKDNLVVIENTRTGAGFKIKGHWPPALYNIYAQPDAICPEAFYEFDLSPGKHASWDTEYAFFVRAK